MKRDEAGFELQMRLPDRWEAMYRFTLVPRPRADFEMSNWFTAAHPRTRFVRNLVAARVVGQSRVGLLNASLAVRGPDGAVEQRTLKDAAELRDGLEGDIGLELPVPAEAIWARLPTQPVPSWP